MRLLKACVGILVTTTAIAAPPGFVKTTIQFPLGAGPPVALAFDSAGILYALEAAVQNQVILHIIQPDGTISTSFTVSGEDPDHLYVGGMAFDAVNNRLLVSDNAGIGRLYAVDLSGTKNIVAEGITFIAGVAVRDSGEVFVSTATGGYTGKVLQIVNGVPHPVLSGLDYGAGLAFDASNNLIVQDVSFMWPTFEPRGRLQKLPISSDASGLHFGPAELLMDNMLSSYAIALDAQDNIFATGMGGLYQVNESPLAEVSIAPSQFSAAATLLPGTRSFQAFAGPGGGKLAYAAEATYGMEDSFVTVLTPAEPGDYNADGHVDALDYNVWRGALDTDDPAADGNLDGHVDAADYVLWRKHVANLVADSAAIPIFTIPEPISLLLAAMALAIVATGSRRVSR